MKFFGAFVFVTLLNLVSVKAGPTPSVYLNDSYFNYYAQEEFTECYITGLTSKAKNTRSLTITSSVKDQSTGKRYNVGGLMADLTGAKATKITIPSGHPCSFSIYDNVLKNAKYLKELKIATSKEIYVYDNTFTGVNQDIDITGKGVNNMVKRYTKKYLQENLPEFIQNYSNLSEYDTRISLYNIAKIVKDYQINLSMAHGDNGAVALFLKQGSTLGINRAAYYFALASGFPEKDIIVAGDNLQHGFCLVNFNRKWYVYDAAKGHYNDREPWSFFQNINDYMEHTLNPYYGRLFKSDLNSFVVYRAKYGYSGEANPEKENYYSFWSSM